MRILRHLAKRTVRSRPAAVSKLMAYIPTAGAAAYLREPDAELPLPGGELARRINALPTAGDRLHTWHTTTNKPVPDSRGSSSSEPVERAYVQKAHEQLGTAGR
ncbi:hypothetical protein ACWD7F_19480 [Streptomyces sp. NPDC005122]